MSWEAALVQRLLDDPAVAAIAGQRIEWDELAPDTPLPAITLQVISDPQPQNNDGFDTFWPSRIQLSSLAKKKADAIALAKAAVDAVIPDAVVGTTTFLRSFVDGGGSDALNLPTGRRCRNRKDLIIWHN
jgi:hypothetical protein